MTKDREYIWQVRNLLANHEMEKFYDTTRELVDTYGTDGAEIFLQAQLQFVRDVREARLINGGDDFGDEL